MVAPGVAMTAGHVVNSMREHGFLAEAGGQLFAIGFHAERTLVWIADSFSPISEGDLSLLTLIRHEPPKDEPPGPVPINIAVMDARMPRVGEHMSLIGFAAADIEFEGGAPIGLSLLGGVGPVSDVYPFKRDRALPNPAACVAAKTVNGMSGGAAFDETGKLIGVISKGIGDEHSFISLSWPAMFIPLELSWPPGLVENPTSLAKLAAQGLCGIEHLSDLQPFKNELGHSMVSLAYELSGDETSSSDG